MPAVVKVGETTINLGDVPVSVLAQVAADCDVPWVQLVDAPLMDLSVALALHKAVAAWAQVTCPDVAELGWQEFLELWTVAPDDLPTEYEDGIPKAGADPTTDI